MNAPAPQRDEDREVPLEDERSEDDRDEGWGGAPSSQDATSDDERYLRERPPHWD